MTIEEYLLPQKEKIPQWLIEYTEGENIDIKKVLSSRMVYYPGALYDGQPVKTFNKAHYAHVFLYADYNVNRENYLHEIVDSGFRGYHIIGSQAIKEEEIVEKPWQQHINNSIISNKRNIDVIPFCEATIFERNENMTEEHGNKRFVLVYLAADGIATYDALFGNKNYKLDTLILQDHGWGCNYDRFGRDGLMDYIAQKTDTFPQKILCDSDDNVWKNYKKVAGIDPVIGGMNLNCRYLYEREVTNG